MKKLSIIIPVFNEESTIFEVLKIVQELTLINEVEKEIVVVNDCSTDGSKSEIERFQREYSNLVFVDQLLNEGKGGAIHNGVRYATGDYVIIQDADLELNPEEINRLIEPVIKGNADVVYGSRFLKSSKIEGQGYLSKLANSFLTTLSNLVFRIEITDMETCYKLIPTSVFKTLILQEKRFGFEPEVTAKLAKIRGLKWKEVPISYFPRNTVQGKKIGWKDGVRAAHCIIKYGWLTPKKRSVKQG